MDKTYNFNFTVAELNLVLGGLSELPVKTGAAHLMMKIERIVAVQDQLTSSKGEVDISCENDDSQEI